MGPCERRVLLPVALRSPPAAGHRALLPANRAPHPLPRPTLQTPAVRQHGERPDAGIEPNRSFRRRRQPCRKERFGAGRESIRPDFHIGPVVLSSACRNAGRIRGGTECLRACSVEFLASGKRCRPHLGKRSGKEASASSGCCGRLAHSWRCPSRIKRRWPRTRRAGNPPTKATRACRVALPPGEVIVEAVRCVLSIAGMGQPNVTSGVGFLGRGVPGRGNMGRPGQRAGPRPCPDVPADRVPCAPVARRETDGRNVPGAEPRVYPGGVDRPQAIQSADPIRIKARNADGSLSRRARGLRQKRVESVARRAGWDVGVPGLTPRDHSLRRMRSGFSSPRRSLPMLSL